MAEESPEQQLLRAAREGNLDSFDELVRKQLLARDKLARTIVTHAIETGDAERLKMVVKCARERLSAEEVLWLFGRTRTGKVANPDLAVKAAGAAIASRIGDTVQRAVEENVADLEKEDAIDKRTSTLQSKILKFVPSEMIIIFQILLAQVASNEWHAFALLVVMTLVSPLVTWAANQMARDDMPGVLSQLKSREKPTASADPRHSWMTIFLSAPAFFFWAIGTSTVAQGVIGWSDGLTNAFFTVANIVIPGVDAFYEAMALRWDMGDMGEMVAAVTYDDQLPPDGVFP
eukprot:g2558.t2